MNLSAPPPRCWAEIDLAALSRNLERIRAALPRPMRYIAVVKADAYGHGLPEAAAALQRVAPDLFAVANVAEAIALRQVEADRPILLLSPVLPAEDGFLATHRLTSSISSPEEVGRFAAAAQAAGRPLPVQLKIDTGMGRAGVWHEAAVGLYRQITASPHLRLEGVFTHFANADADPAFTAEQRRRFLAVLGTAGVPRAASFLVHADNSAGLESLAATGPFNAVRIGLLQFGVLPHPASPSAAVGVQPVFSLRTRVGLVKALPKGADVSYGRTHTLRRNSMIAILCAGYGDGLPRAASNRGQVLIRGQRCPILGRVTMDMTIVDVTDLPGVAAGEEVVLVGRQAAEEISLGEWSVWADTIPWEFLCSITKRVPRIYSPAPAG